MKALERKTANLRRLVRSFGSAAVAFSGGTDSALLARVALDELGPNAVAVTISSPMIPPSELSAARTLARTMGIEHVVIESNLLSDRRFAMNPVDRCYICKTDCVKRIRRLADDRGLGEVLDGTNADDLQEHRPGSRAREELGVRSPLAEVGLTKDEVRRLSKAIGLPTADKGASACLASRVPYGDEITTERLRMIDRAERYLRSKGFREVRVRAHGPVARIEVSRRDIALLSSQGMREQVVRRLRALGFTYVSADLSGYRTGSMDEVPRR